MPDEELTFDAMSPVDGSASYGVAHLLESKEAPLTFDKLAAKHAGRPFSKWTHYGPIYDRHFAKFRGKAPRVLEIGVCDGGSLEIWHQFFGPGTKIVGVDVDPRCKAFEDENTKIVIGDQGDRNFIRRLWQTEEPFDVIIDDGGHTMVQQITTFDGLYESLRVWGVYLVEDVHTSYWPDWGGGHYRKGTFMEFAKDKCDELNGHHIEMGKSVTRFTQMTASMHFYDSIVVFEKDVRVTPPAQSRYPLTS